MKSAHHFSSDQAINLAGTKTLVKVSPVTVEIALLCLSLDKVFKVFLTCFPNIFENVY